MDAEEVAISLVSRLEILRGRVEAFIKAADAEEILHAVAGLAKSEEFLTQFQIVALDGAAAEQFDTLRANKTFKKMDRGDLLQAAIALANRATLVTRNTKDYAGVPGPKVENWAD